jgi:hypothetical protein
LLNLFRTCLDGEIEIFNGLKLNDIDNPFSLGFYKSKKVTFKIPEFEQGNLIILIFYGYIKFSKN